MNTAREEIFHFLSLSLVRNNKDIQEFVSGALNLGRRVD